jgi:hypothetical protein
MFISAEPSIAVAELVRKLLARGTAAVELENFHQVDNRTLPVEILILAVGDLFDLRLQIGLGDRSGRC